MRDYLSYRIVINPKINYFLVQSLCWSGQFENKQSKEVLKEKNSRKVKYFFEHF